MTDAAADHGHQDHVEEEEVLAADDPRTPAWLTALGGILFCVALGWVLVSQGEAGRAAVSNNEAVPSNAAMPNNEANGKVQGPTDRERVEDKAAEDRAAADVAARKRVVRDAVPVPQNENH